MLSELLGLALHDLFHAAVFQLDSLVAGYLNWRVDNVVGFFELELVAELVVQVS